MTRQYWSNHAKHEGLITDDPYVAELIIRSFKQPETPLELHIPYMNWKQWLAKNPIRKPRDK